MRKGQFTMKIIEETLPFHGRLTGYLHDMEAAPDMAYRPCIVICPGGGYEFCSDLEKDPVAAAFFAAGYHTFLIDYAVGREAAKFQPLIQLSAALVRIRENRKEWRVTNKIAVCGFSAGAHLACSAGLLWNDPTVQSALHEPGRNARPDAMILCYPVITGGKYAHRGSLSLVTGSETENELWSKFSLESQVTTDTPPSFLWHTVNDACVPVENTLLLACALQKYQVPFECHLYENGRHGMSMCTAEVDALDSHVGTWFSLCCEWLQNHLF